MVSIKIRRFILVVYWAFAVVVSVILFPLLFLLDCIVSTEENLKKKGNVAFFAVSQSVRNTKNLITQK